MNYFLNGFVGLAFLKTKNKKKREREGGDTRINWY